MTTLLLSLGTVLAYCLIGALYARSQAVAAYQRACKAGWYSEQSKRESVNMQLFWRVFAWPWALVLDAVRPGTRSWFHGPLDARKAHAAKLRVDAEYWDGVAREEIDSEKKAMAEELARSLREQAKGVEL